MNTSMNVSIAMILSPLSAFSTFLASWPNSLDQFAINFANKRLHNFVQKELFKTHIAEYNGISRFVLQIPYFDNSECV